MEQTILYSNRSKPLAALKALRPHQWSKNILVLAPLFLAHEAGDLSRLAIALIATVCFCLMASAIYLLNDVMDVERDRAHPHKRHRPIAAGELGRNEALIIASFLGISSLVLALVLTPLPFTLVLIVYLITTISYSVKLKGLLLLDVACLSFLYNLRLIGGGMAVDVPLSPWLLGLSLFLFTSLAFAKRYTEVAMYSPSDHLDKNNFGRAYHVHDLPIIGVAGTATGIISVLVLSLYITDGETINRYSSPEYLWVTSFILLFWVIRVWVFSYRKQMHSDPIIFAFRDRPSLLMGVAIVMCFLLAY